MWQNYDSSFLLFVRIESYFNGTIDFADIKGNGTFNVRGNHITLVSEPVSVTFKLHVIIINYNNRVIILNRRSANVWDLGIFSMIST